MKKSDKVLLQRYPGVTPFSMEQRSVFFGRERDIEQLHELVSRQQLVLLYSKSGLGKSSLINAGLLPRLQEQNPDLHPVIVRFGAYVEGARSPIQAVLDALQGDQTPADYGMLDRIFPQENSLWYHFKARQTADPKVRYLLVFDQFEELFTYPEDDLLRFKRQMGDLLYRVLPPHFRKALTLKQNKNPEILGEDELRRLNQAQNIQCLLAIREDRYSLLNQLTDYLPEVLHTRYALEPLGREQAEQAIVEPAARPGKGFASEPFRYTEEALDKILRFLTREGSQPVETTQLQILCNRLEQLKLSEVRPDDIPDFQDIFLDYYYDTLQRLPEGSRRELQVFIETQLVQKGQRISLDGRVFPDVLDGAALRVLVQEQHLLRAEPNSTGGISYELSHDTLLAPVMEARSRREAAEAAEAERQAQVRRAAEQAERARQLQLELQAQAQEKQRQARQLRNTRLLLLFALLALIGAGVSAFVAFNKSREAQAATKKAEEATEKAIESGKKAQQSLNVATKNIIDRLITEVNAYNKVPEGKPDVLAKLASIDTHIVKIVPPDSALILRIEELRKDVKHR